MNSYLARIVKDLMGKVMKSGEYVERGEYHRNLDPKWSYYPIYIRKMKIVQKIISQFPQNSNILDVGCGEGVLVEQLRKKGYGVWGIDLNFGSSKVILGNACELPFKAESFNLVLMLDIIEHLHFHIQEVALSEVYRVTKMNGHILLSIPNLAHLASRLKFLIKGQFIRTSRINKHPGDRPICEYLDLLHKVGFEIISRRGISITIPFIGPRFYSLPSVLSSPDISLTNIILARKSVCD